MFTSADKRRVKKDERTHNAPESSEIASIILGPENGEVVTGEVMLCKAYGTYLNGNKQLYQVRTDHRFYHFLMSMLHFLYGTDD